MAGAGIVAPWVISFLFLLSADGLLQEPSSAVDPHNFQINAPGQTQRADGGWNYDPLQQFLLEEKDNMAAALEKFEAELETLRAKVEENANNLGAEVQQLQ